MGRTPKPLTILVSSRVYELNRTKFDAMREQGHDIDVCEFHADIVLAENAWRYVDGLESAIDVAIRAARDVRYKKA